MAQVPLANIQPLPIPLMTGGTSTTDDGNVQGAFAVNTKLRQIPTKDKPGTCTSHGGLSQWMASSAIGESDRGGILWNGIMYRVQGGSVYSYTTAGVRTKIGSVANDGLRVRLDYGFDNLIIVSAGLLYYYAPTGYSNATGATVVSGGTGYAVNDTITIGPLGVYATLKVTAVSGGAATVADQVHPVQPESAGALERRRNGRNVQPDVDERRQLPAGEHGAIGRHHACRRRVFHGWLRHGDGWDRCLVELARESDVLSWLLRQR
jgi:hypothetical protein